MENKGSPGILITELKKIRSCAKCIGKPTLIWINLRNLLILWTKPRQEQLTEVISAEINHTTKKPTAEVKRKEGNPAPKKLNAKETITEEPPKTSTKQVYQNTDIDMLCTPGSLNRMKMALAAFSENRILEHGRLQYMGSK